MGRVAVALAVLGFTATLLVFLIVFRQNVPLVPLAPNFDTYVINMQKNASRMNHFRRQYNNSELASRPFTRVEAVNGLAMSDDEFKSHVSPRVYIGLNMLSTSRRRIGDDQLTPGMIGCYLSHYKVYEMIRASGTPYAIVFEDDARINRRVYTGAVQAIVEEDGTIPKDWDIILLGHICKKCERATPYVKIPRYFWGTHGYMISQKGVAAMMKYREPEITMQIDHLMSQLCQEDKLRIYALHPTWVNTSNFGSDIQVRVTK